ncbi:carbohydrate ABC transporter permease [Murimonas intestini]|uniref:carbohydrate ABC transporter permease n=1 Tax=Murimonas intestini TaxID=1337051 RepID=UPI000D6AE0B1
MESGTALPDIALYSVIFTDVWKGVSIVTAIYIAGLQAIDRNYYEAASIDGAGGWQRLVHITLPLIRPSMNSVILLSLIGGLRNFVMIWAMTGGGPGFATDVLSSAVYKQYAAGFYGLSTAGNVIMFILVAAFGYPRTIFVYAH